MSNGKEPNRYCVEGLNLYHLFDWVKPVVAMEPKEAYRKRSSFLTISTESIAQNFIKQIKLEKSLFTVSIFEFTSRCIELAENCIEQ